MTDFSIDENGLLAERSIHELGAWYSQFPESGNPLNYEAHVMLLRAYSSLTTLASSSGLGRARYNVIRILYQQPDQRLQMTDIGVGLNVSLTNVTKLIDGLERDGLVRRVPHENDKRRTWAELTESGTEAFKHALPRVFNFTDGIWGHFTDDEKRLLIHLLSKLRLVLLSGGVDEQVQSVLHKGGNGSKA